MKIVSADKFKIKDFRQKLLAWHSRCRRQFPWRENRSPFQILIAEILLQQTNAQKVWAIYESFIIRFPDPKSLANASIIEIRGFLKSLGLYYRAERLHQIASVILKKFDGNVPNKKEDLLSLPGIGLYVASAIMCFAFNERAFVFDRNFARLYTRFFGLHNKSDRPERDNELLGFSKTLLPKNKTKEYNYAVLDFAATICTLKNTKCKCCPLVQKCSKPANLSGKELLGLDLFAGAGGLSLGATNKGIRMAYAIEADRNAAATYEFNMPSTAVAKEFLTTKKIKTLCNALGILPGSIDVIIAGPPCQGFSIANLKTRNDLNPNNHAWKTIIKFISFIKPQGIIIENVGGMATYKNGYILNKINSLLKKLGYQSKVYYLDAVDFGVPQRRKRIFITAITNGTLPEAVIFNNKITATVGEAIRDLPLVSNGSNIEILPYRLDCIALSNFQKQMRKNKSKSVRNCCTSRNTNLIIKRFASVPQGGNWIDIPEKLFQTYKKPENCHRWLYKRLSEDKPSVTISNFRKNMLIHPWENRTLTVREAARLQGIHDGFCFLGKLHSQQQQVANAVPPQLAEAVTRVILKGLKKGTSHE